MGSLQMFGVKALEEQIIALRRSLDLLRNEVELERSFHKQNIVNSEIFCRRLETIEKYLEIQKTLIKGLIEGLSDKKVPEVKRKPGRPRKSK